MSRFVPRRVVALLTLALAGAGAAARAQTPEERVRLDSIRTSFASVTDSSLLIERERERIAVARTDRDDPFIHMELGWLSYRLGELTGAKRRYEDAASEFQWAADLRPRWAYAWYWLGMAELGTGESDLILVENLRQVLGQDALSVAATSFARALEVDPGFAAALVDLAGTALRQRVSPRLVVAQRALRAAAALPAARGAPVLLMRGRIERRLGANDSALAALRDYLVAGGDTGVALLEMARAHAALGRRDSALAAYHGGAARAVSDSTRRGFRLDLRWIASPDEVAAFDTLPPDSVGPWLERFWERRDVSDGRRPGERLLEQLRRLQLAQERYALVSRRRGFAVGYAYRDTSQSDFDDRGVIYLRHGEPHARATYQEQGVEPNESWRYDRPGETPLIFHFVAREDVQDYRLVETLMDVLGGGIGLQVQANLDARMPGAISGLYSSRSGFGPLYDRFATGGSMSRSTMIAEERAAGRQMVRQGTTTDSYVLRFASDLRPVVSTFLVQGPGEGADRGELHVVFALPAQRLQPATAEAGAGSGGSAVYPLAMRLEVFDASRRRVAAVDTLRVFRSGAPLGSGAYLTEQLVLGVPAGRYEYRFVVEELGRSAGAVIVGSALDVPRYGAVFEASDVVLGREGSGLVWRRADGEVPLNPLQRFPQAGTASLWYEVYGLPQGASVATRVRIERQGGGSVFRRLFGGRGGADLSYSTVTDAPGRARVRQTIDLSGLSAGRYTLVVELESGGRRLVRRQPFEIAARSP